MRILYRIYSLILSIISKLFWLFELFLFLRLLLKFLGANPKTLIVNLIYKYSDIVISPFNLIFRNIYWGDHLIETSVISAVIGYAIAIFVVFQIIEAFSRN
jgi:hypothetical protein